MTPITLTTSQWLDIDPTYRAIVDHTPHVFAYDEDQARLRLMPVAISNPHRARRSASHPIRELQPA